jgi:serine/threonine protein kinase
VYFKREVDEDLKDVMQQMVKLRQSYCLRKHPNIIPYQEWQESPKSSSAFLVRQFFMSNLYDRLSTRPFLTHIEKKWLAFQLIKALVQLKSGGFCHGDIKSENIMVTSWGWLYLTDMASFKPAYLPEDDPADFYYYFEAGERKRCYLAPERFYRTGQASSKGVLPMLMDSNIATEDADNQIGRSPNSGGKGSSRPEGQLREAMDIFSTGCVIGELFGGGVPLFDLPALLRYRTGDCNALEEGLRKLDDPVAQEMARHMLHVRASERLTAEEYLHKFGAAGGRAGHVLFDGYFEYLFEFMVGMAGPGGAATPDERVHRVCRNYGELLERLAGVSDPKGEKFFYHMLSLIDSGTAPANSKSRVKVPSTSNAATPPQPPGSAGKTKAAPISATWSDERTRELLQLTEDFLASLGETVEADSGAADGAAAESGAFESSVVQQQGAGGEQEEDEDSAMAMFSPIVRKPQTDGATGAPPAKGDNGLVIVLSLVCSSVRHVRTPFTKLTSLLLLVRLGAYVSDEARLQRLIPYIVGESQSSLLYDSSSVVRAAAVRGLCKLLGMVKSFPPVDANIFPQYILPALAKFPSDPEEMVRIAFANCLPSYAETARRFLDIAHQLQRAKQTAERAANMLSPGVGMSAATPPRAGSSTDDNSDGLITASYDKELKRLHNMVSRLVVQVTAPDMSQKGSGAHVKRALLLDITRLCLFFGRERTLDVVLPQLITFLNDRDNGLRADFFDCITGVCTFIGSLSVDLIIMPCIEVALIDVEERVIARALHCLTTLCELGLFRKNVLVERAEMTAPLLFHPSVRIRDSVAVLMSVVANQLGSPDVHAFLVPVLRPYVKPGRKMLGADLDLESIRTALKRPVSRKVFDDAMYAAEKGEHSFFGAQQMQKGKGKGEGGEGKDGEDQEGGAGGNNEEDEERSKLLVMQSYIQSASQHMRAKMHIWQTEHAQRLQDGRGGESEVQIFSRKLQRSVHQLYVPDQHFAPLHRMREPPASLVAQSAAGGSVGMKGRLSGEEEKEEKTATTVAEVMYQYSVSPSATGATSVGGGAGAGLGDGTGEDMGGAKGGMEPELAESRQSAGVAGGGASGSSSSKARMERQLGMGVGAAAKVDPALMDGPKLRSRLDSLQVPCLPPDLGRLRYRDGTAFSMYQNRSPLREGSSSSSGSSGAGTAAGGGAGGPGMGGMSGANSNPNAGVAMGGAAARARKGIAIGLSQFDKWWLDWRPREGGVLLANLDEHKGAVRRLAISQDHTFFASGSADGTVKIWESRRLQREVGLKSRLTYSTQGGQITDICMCDNSHSVASASTNGSVHVFKVEYGKLSSRQTGGGDRNAGSANNNALRVVRTSPVRQLDAKNEGAALMVRHFTTHSHSMLV